ncbi:MAG: hypothetical protein ACLFTR_05165, partial [Candidatus Woesearchaeota archaeon]
MAGRLPRFKKKVSDFLSQEDGRITKQSAVAVGTFAVIGVVSSLTDVSAGFNHHNNLGSGSYDSSSGS